MQNAECGDKMGIHRRDAARLNRNQGRSAGVPTRSKPPRSSAPHFRTRSSVHIAAGEDTRTPWPIEKSSQSSTNCFYSTAEGAERLFVVVAESFPKALTYRFLYAVRQVYWLGFRRSFLSCRPATRLRPHQLGLSRQARSGALDHYSQDNYSR